MYATVRGGCRSVDRCSTRSSRLLVTAYSAEIIAQRAVQNSPRSRTPTRMSLSCTTGRYHGWSTAGAAQIDITSVSVHVWVLRRPPGNRSRPAPRLKRSTETTSGSLFRLIVPGDEADAAKAIITERTILRGIAHSGTHTHWSDGRRAWDPMMRHGEWVAPHRRCLTMAFNRMEPAQFAQPAHPRRQLRWHMKRRSVGRTGTPEP